MQLVQDVAPADEVFPAGHTWQDASDVPSVDVEYLPATQSMQPKAPASEYLPAAQTWQDCCPELVLKRPAGQLMQLVSEMDATVVEYLPGAQGVQPTFADTPSWSL
jgi:hypothetical protein